MDAGTNNNGNNNIFIGQSAGGTLTDASNRLIIDVTNTTTPLVDGDFGADLFKINGDIQATERLFDSDGDAGTNGQLLSSTGSGTNWTDIVSKLVDLTDVDTSNIQNNYVLKWDASMNKFIVSVDATTSSGESSFTEADRLKLDGIQTGAEVNAIIDWVATSGDEQIINKPSTFPPSTHTHLESDIPDLQHFTNDDIRGDEGVFDPWDQDESDDLTASDTTGSAGVATKHQLNQLDLSQDDLSDNNTDNLAEGATNLYYTEARVNANPTVSSALQENDISTLLNSFNLTNSSEAGPAFTTKTYDLQFTNRFGATSNYPLSFTDNDVYISTFNFTPSSYSITLNNGTNIGGAFSASYLTSADLVDSPIDGNLNPITSNAVFDNLALKENAFSKNSAFNKPFGFGVGTVAEGNGPTHFKWRNGLRMGGPFINWIFNPNLRNGISFFRLG